jgi:hypothetical protein
LRIRNPGIRNPDDQAAWEEFLTSPQSGTGKGRVGGACECQWIMLFQMSFLALEPTIDLGQQFFVCCLQWDGVAAHRKQKSRADAIEIGIG